MRDTGINIFSILTAILPSAIQLRVTGAEAVIAPEWNCDIHDRIQLAAADGVTGSIDLDWLYPGPEERTIEVLTESGTLAIDISRDGLSVDAVPVAIPDSQPGLAAEYSRMISDFTRCLEAGESSCGTEEIRLVESALEIARPRADA